MYTLDGHHQRAEKTSLVLLTWFRQDASGPASPGSRLGKLERKKKKKSAPCMHCCVIAVSIRSVEIICIELFIFFYFGVLGGFVARWGYKGEGQRVGEVVVRKFIRVNRFF